MSHSLKVQGSLWVHSPPKHILSIDRAHFSQRYGFCQGEQKLNGRQVYHSRLLVPPTILFPYFKGTIQGWKVLLLTEKHYLLKRSRNHTFLALAQWHLSSESMLHSVDFFVDHDSKIYPSVFLLGVIKKSVLDENLKVRVVKLASATYFQRIRSISRTSPRVILPCEEQTPINQ